MSTTNNGRGNNQHQHADEAEKHDVPITGVTYYFKVDGKVLKADAAIVKARDILTLVGLNAETHQLIKVIKGQPNEAVPPDATIDLNKFGVEEFITEKRLVVIFFKNTEFKIPVGEIHTKDLKKIFGLAQACHLAVLAGDELKPLPDNGTFFVRGGEHFASYPCDGSAS